MKPQLKTRLNIILGIAVAILLYLYVFNPQVEEVEIPVRFEVPVPVVEKEFDTIKLPPEIIRVPGKTEIDSAYYKQYLALKDSIQKDSLFKEAIKIREYKPTVEDDTIKIDVYAKVRGELLETAIKYKTKPRTVTLDTTLTVPIPRKAKLFGGFSLGMPIVDKPDLNVTPVFKGGLFLKTKKDGLIKVEFDTQGRVWAGYAWKF